MDTNVNSPIPTPSQAQPPAAPPTGVTPDPNKIWAIIGYILPILFFVPLLGNDKDQPVVRFHANQQLNLLLFWVVVGVILPLIPVIGLVLMPIAYVAGFALMIIGLMNVAHGSKKPLPLIGKIELIK